MDCDCALCEVRRVGTTKSTRESSMELTEVSCMQCGYCEHQRRERELALAISVGALYATVIGLSFYIWATRNA